MVSIKSPQWSYGADGARVSFLVSSVEVAQALCASIEPNKEYDLEVKKHRQKRSKNANDLLWELCTQIAERVSNCGVKVAKEDVYRKNIREAGVCEFLSLPAPSVERFREGWQHNGVGWFIDVIDSAPGQYGEVFTVCAYYGSSTYDTTQMSLLLEAVIQDCKALGIEIISDSDRALLAQYPWGQRV